MKKKILILGTVDTKGEQLKFLKEQIESRGHIGILMDISMGGESAIKSDITPEEIARLGGAQLDEIITSKDRLFVMSTTFANFCVSGS